MKSRKPSRRNLYFIRDEFLSDPYIAIDDRTEVLLFGDLAGFQYLQDCLLKAQTSTRCVHLTHLDMRTFTMSCTILPAQRSVKRARLKFLERLIFVGRQPRIEFLIYGTLAGYRSLSRTLQATIRRTDEDVEKHFHLDNRFDRSIASGSINLQVCQPLRVWKPDKLPRYVHKMIYHKPNGTFQLNSSRYQYELSHPVRYKAPNPNEDPVAFSLR